MAALFEAQAPVVPPPPAGFIANGLLPLAFIPLAERETGVLSPEGCEMEAGTPLGALGAPAPGGICHSASHGWLEFTADIPAEFTSSPLDRPIVVGDSVSIVAHVADPLRSLASAAVEGRFEYRFDAIAADGTDDVRGAHALRRRSLRATPGSR